MVGLLFECLGERFKAKWHLVNGITKIDQIDIVAVSIDTHLETSKVQVLGLALGVEISTWFSTWKLFLIAQIEVQVKSSG